MGTIKIETDPMRIIQVLADIWAKEHNVSVVVSKIGDGDEKKGA